jgi:hypothetical protein
MGIVGNLVIMLSMLIWSALMAAILGGAMAGGAWVVWRLLEKHAPAPPMTERRRRTVGPGVWFGVAVAGALWFAFGMPDTMRLLPQPGPSMGLRHGAVISLLPFVPLLVLLSVAGLVIWLVRKATGGTPPGGV